MNFRTEDDVSLIEFANHRGKLEITQYQVKQCNS